MSERKGKKKLGVRHGRTDRSGKPRIVSYTSGGASRLAALSQPELVQLDWPAVTTRDVPVPAPRIRVSRNVRCLEPQRERVNGAVATAGNAVRNGAIKGNGTRRREWALALHDSANIYCTLMRALGGRRPKPHEQIDLARLYGELRRRYNLRRFLYVIRDDPNRSYRALRDHVKRCHCTWKAVRRTTRSNRCPVDVFILERLRAATSTLGAPGLGPRTVILLSHDGDFARAGRAYLEAGGHLVLAGFIGAFSKKTYALFDHPRCEIIDLRFELRVLGPQPTHA